MCICTIYKSWCNSQTHSSNLFELLCPSFIYGVVLLNSIYTTCMVITYTNAPRVIYVWCQTFLSSSFPFAKHAHQILLLFITWMYFWNVRAIFLSCLVYELRSIGSITFTGPSTLSGNSNLCKMDVSCEKDFFLATVAILDLF